ncbi:MAG: tRNA (adenosine(37)-N6)-threonylcarbamoyltransferase complex transferase subunit TsaD [Phycisphaeraceae bacterium]|nr:tRNA (adenosine(37)-N6)-threonylcarbamoyltransferase complex transferase subunit TsaD [Phycisphaeraceae bacterium]MCW5755111.1 tRNA (adenosine(37)-N6)-threonylcarbamoyltransferase complex transferase subunit TsaD [Phycisphaeraceae bacterium]
MLVLGLETSCDETACALVADGRTVRSNVIASQHELHAEYQGVVPEIASRAHVERLTPVLREALRQAGVQLDDVEAVAVGNRPGLIGSLLVGVSAAKGLAWGLGVPLVGVDHIHAHLYAGLLETEDPPFPALGLVVSGGHTSMYFMRSPIELHRIGATIDDALGEAYDKVATILGLPYPGGPMVDRLAASGDPHAFDFPVSRLAPGSLDFSFSGLKTAVLYAVRGVPGADAPARTLTDGVRADVCASFQRAASRAVILKLERAFAQLEAEGARPRSLLTGGGVTANSRLRAELTAFCITHGVEFRLPAMAYCMDNAAMIAGLGERLLASGHRSDMTLYATPVTTC